ncbi:MAG: hypothetical protein Q8L51_00525 [Candidatus Amesbacteria bacterium]|nr:hypothetical protein [Candidatus Amesbacteria bacterium]
MNWKVKIIQSLESEIVVLNKALETTRIAQREAPSAMESASNTTRSEMERMVTALEIDIDSIKKNIKLMENYMPKYHEINNNGKTLKIILVPDGIGGKKIDDVMLVSENAPIAKNLKI